MGSPGKFNGIKKLSNIPSPSEVVMMTDAGAIPPLNDSPARPASTPGSDWTEELVQDPSSTSLKYSSYLIIPASYYGTSGYYYKSRAYASPFPRHLDTTNVLWADGHVKAMRPESIMSLKKAAGDSTVKPTSCFLADLGCSGGS